MAQSSRPRSSSRRCSRRSTSTQQRPASSTVAISVNIGYVSESRCAVGLFSILFFFFFFLIMQLYNAIQQQLTDDDSGAVDVLLRLWQHEREDGVRMHAWFHSIVTSLAGGRTSACRRRLRRMPTTISLVLRRQRRSVPNATFVRF
jgi:hypothetical protein